MDADMKETLSRPIKYAVIACYATRDAIKDIDVDGEWPLFLLGIIWG